MYRLVGQISTFFVPDEKLDYTTFFELQSALTHWVSLSLAVKLPLLLQHEDYREVRALQESGASQAELFRCYINVHKAQAGFDKWTAVHMDNVPFAIYEVVL